jgi:branched-chain amino acid transport system substrate-binding protein
MRNRIVKGEKLGIAVLAIALVALLLGTACAPASTVKGKTVVVGGIFSLTGGAGADCQIQLMGIQDYLRYFNEQQGIPGVSIQLSWGDCAANYAVFRSTYEKFVERGIPVMMTLEAIGMTADKDRFAKDEVVMLGDAMGFEEMSYSPGWRYCMSPTLAEQFAAVVAHFSESWEEARPPKVAFIAIDHFWGRDPQAEGTKYAQSLGFEVLPPEFVPFVVLDASTQLLRLKEEGADLVYLQALVGCLGPILRDAERLGLVGQMQFAGFGGTISNKIIDMSGVASEGYLMSMISPWFDETDIPGVRLMLDTQMKYHGKVERQIAYCNGWVETAVACEAIKRAIEDVGYDNLDGMAIKEALDNMQDFDVDGLASITYKDRVFDHRGTTKLAICEITGGKIVRVTDWREAPSLVPEGLVRE